MLCQYSAENPMKNIINIAKKSEAERNVLAASIFCGFPLADVQHARMSSVVVFDSKQAGAEKICNHILDTAWQQKKAFVYHPQKLSNSIARAKKLRDYPILLIDHGDNCGAGGSQDDMSVVKEVIKQGLDDVVVGAICDPEAVHAMIRSGIGNQITVSLGGKSDSPSINYNGSSLQITGVVRAITDGEFVITGPMLTGMVIRLGRTAVLDTGSIQFIVTENRHEPKDLGLFRSVGIEPTQRKYLLLKSRVHYRAAFLPIAKHVVECAGLGAASSDYSIYPFSKLKRPIYPIDNI
jgi:microcystin degradation protein MlrC